jgi:hypothetical protein
MDDNTAKVLLIAIVLAFVYAILRRFDRVTIRVERLRLEILGLVKLGTGMLKVAAERWKPERRTISFSGDIPETLHFMQGSFALTQAIRIVPGNHDIDIIAVTQPDDDHRNGLIRLIQCKNYRWPK